MKQALFIMADPNGYGFLHKGVLPTLKLAYAKNGIKVHVINLYKDGFNPLSDGDIITNSFVKSYKHYIKISDHIHIMSPTRLGALSPAAEGFINKILINQYLDQGQKLNKKVFFHVFQDTKIFNLINIIYLRLKLLVIPKIFKSGNIYQYDFQITDKSKRTKTLQDLKIKILKNIQ